MADDNGNGQQEPERDEDGVLPFFDIAAQSDGTVRVRAGWVDEQYQDVQTLAIDANVGITRAETAMVLALGWYADQLQYLEELAEQQAQAPAEVGPE